MMMIRSLALLLLLAPAALAVDVEGYVYTVDGTPIAKATVTAGNQRVTTSEDGRFVLTAPADSIVAIEVRAEKLPPQKLFALAGDPPLTVTLAPEAEAGRDGMITTATARPMTAGPGVRRAPTPANAKRDRVITGVVRIGKRPLAHAPVSVMPIVEEYAEPTIVTADEKGRFRISVAPGRYIVAPHPELAPRLQSVHPSRMWEGDSPFVVDVTKAAEAVADLDLVAPPLLTGRVVDAEGKPVGRADVLPVLAGRSPLEFFHQPIVRTLPNGTFAAVRPPFEERQPLEIVVTPPRHSSTRSSEMTVKLPKFDEVTVRVTDRAGKALPEATVAYAASDELSDFGSPILLMPHITRRRVRADAKGEVTLHLTPGEYEFAAMAPKHQARTLPRPIARSAAFEIALEQGYTIRGRVRRGEQPVAGVDVTIRRGPGVPRAERRIVTDEKGVFTFDALARGSYDLHVFKHDEMIDKMLTVEAPGDADVQLPAAATLQGRVIDAETRAPVPQFFLTIEPAADRHGREARGMVHRRESSSDGTFAATVPVGAYRVTAGANGYLPSEAVEVQVTERGATPVELRLGRGAIVTGRVTDEDGKPLAEANVMVSGEVGEITRSARPLMRTGVSGAQTGDDGTFTLSGLETGPAQLVVRRTGYVLQRKAIDVEPETRVDVTLTRGLGITGTVTLGGKPVAGANVSASTSAIGSDHQTATTDERGRFTLEGLVPARYTVHAAYNEHNTQIENVDVAQRRELNIEFENKSRAVIFGTVTGIPRGGRATRGHVFAQAASHGAEGTIDAAGNYRIENAPAGTVEISVEMQTAPGSAASARKRVEVAPGQTVRVDLDLTPALTVSGRVTHASRAVPRAHVAFMSEEHGFVGAVTRDDGTYEIGLPSPGRYQVHVSAEAVTSRGFQTAREFRGSETFDIQLTEQIVEGQVVDAQTQQPVAGAIVTLLLRGGGVKQMAVTTESLTDASGRFTMPTSAAGPHLLVVSAPGRSQRSQEVVLGGTEPIRTRFELLPAAELRLRIVDARNGTPLEAHLVLADERGQPLPVRPARSPDGTEFTFSLAPGKYRVTAISASYAEKTVEVSVPGSAVIAME